MAERVVCRHHECGLLTFRAVSVVERDRGGQARHRPVPVDPCPHRFLKPSRRCARSPRRARTWRPRNRAGPLDGLVHIREKNRAVKGPRFRTCPGIDHHRLTRAARGKTPGRRLHASHLLDQLWCRRSGLGEHRTQRRRSQRCAPTNQRRRGIHGEKMKA